MKFKKRAWTITEMRPGDIYVDRLGAVVINTPEVQIGMRLRQPAGKVLHVGSKSRGAWWITPSFPVVRIHENKEW